MTWTQKHTQLNDVLGDLVPYKEGIIKYVRASGLKPQFINFDGNAIDVWNKVISEALKHDRVNDLINVLLAEYENNPFLISALSEKEIDYSLSQGIDDLTDWKGISEDTLEVLTMGRSTILPVNFLAKGIKTSKAVAKVEIKVSSNGYNVGTGFLFKIKDFNELFFITNYHVLNNQEDIAKTRIIFDFELDADGNSLSSKSFRIDETGPWYYSDVSEYDTCIFKLLDENDELKDYGHIALNEINVKKNDFVNIIQHPGGEMKQISLYHNIVTNTGDRTIQYLTDTLKGSSGSPVFNSDWEVVALHHSGGGRKEGEPKLPRGIKSRNEGISINKIIQFLKDNHLN